MVTEVSSRSYFFGSVFGFSCAESNESERFSRLHGAVNGLPRLVRREADLAHFNGPTQGLGACVD